MTRIGGSFPLAPPLKNRIACANGLGVAISSWMASARLLFASNGRSIGENYSKKSGMRASEPVPSAARRFPVTNTASWCLRRLRRLQTGERHSCGTKVTNPGWDNVERTVVHRAKICRPRIHESERCDFFNPLNKRVETFTISSRNTGSSHLWDQPSIVVLSLPSASPLAVQKTVR